ncbi:MAG: PIN domain-containing protein [Candidatus Woesearchaeota archaeon]
MPIYKKILLDTNFLMIPGNFGVDIFEEINRICNFNYKLYLLDKSINELKKLPDKAKKQRTKTKIAVNIALKLVESLVKDGKLNIIPTKTDIKLTKFRGMYVDDIIKDITAKDKDNEYIIATTDIELRKHLKRVVILRQKKYLELIQNTNQ